MPCSQNACESIMVFYETILSDGELLNIKSAIVDFKKRTIVFKIKKQQLMDHCLPTSFSSAEELQNILYHFHKTLLCRGVIKEKYAVLADFQIESGKFTEGIWRSNK